MFQNTMPRYEILSPDAMDVARPRLAPDRLRDRRGVHPPRGRRDLPRRRVQDRRRQRVARPRFRARAGGQGAARVRAAGPQPGEERHHRRRQHGLLARCTGRRSRARETSGGKPPRPTSRTSCTWPRASTSSTRPAAPSASPTTSRSTRATWTWCTRCMTLSDKPHMGSVTSGPNAADTVAMSEILFGGRDAIEPTPASLSLINVNSPLRFDDRMLSRDAHLQPRQPGRDRHAVPADGGDVTGDDPRHAGTADGRGAGRHRADPAGAAGLPGGLRVVPLQHRPAVGLPRLRHPRVRHRPALHRPDRTALRAALAGGRRARPPARRSTPRPPTKR